MLLIPPLDRDSGQPLYEQIYRYLREQIENGTLEADAALPSRRSMASLCGVSINTVENAYAQLTAEGFAIAEPKRGIYVEQLERLPLPESLDGSESHEKPERQENPVKFDCRFGRIDENAFPRKLWHSLLREAIEAPGALRRGDPQGEPALREALCGYLRRLRGVECDPSRIVIGAGLEWLILALLPVFSPSARFGMEDPGYAPYRNLLNAYGRQAVTIPTRQGGIDFSALYVTKPDVIYLQPSHRFPLGGVMSAGLRQQILKWAQWEEQDSYILEDDYDSELRYRGLPIPPLQSMDSKGRVVYLGSFSGSLAPGLRIGYMVLPPALAERFHNRVTSCAVPVPDQLALSQFIRQGHLERHVARMRSLYRRRRERLLELLKPLEPRITAEDDGAGLFVRLSVNIDGDETRALRLAEEGGVRLTGVSQFYVKHSDCNIPRVLFGFGGVRDEDLPEIVRILARVWR